MVGLVLGMVLRFIFGVGEVLAEVLEEIVAFVHLAIEVNCKMDKNYNLSTSF